MIRLIVGNNADGIREALDNIEDKGKDPFRLRAEFTKFEVIERLQAGPRGFQPILVECPETGLHPEDIRVLCEIILALSCYTEVIVFTNSYFVLKNLYNSSQECRKSIPITIIDGEGVREDDLLNGIPENSIIDEYIRLYKEEVELSLAY
jgi:hypothetical protein